MRTSAARARLPPLRARCVLRRHLGAKTDPQNKYELIEASVVPWPPSYLPDETAHALQRKRAHFLWPEHNYFGEVPRSRNHQQQPPG